MKLKRVRIYKEKAASLAGGDLPWSVVGEYDMEDDDPETYCEGIDYFDTWPEALACAERALRAN